MDNVEVSLVLCTRNRAERLRRCLDYIARLKPACGWELVVVDNGSTDGTAELLREYADKVTFPIETLYQPVSGKSRSLNLAWQVARGDIIAFIDDDCYVAPDYIQRTREIFADKRIGFAGGRIELFDPSDIAMTIKTAEQWEMFKPGTLIEGGALLGANTMYRREVLQEIGGFDPDLGPGSRFYGEEMDVQTRASLAGWWGVYSPEVKVAHHHGRKPKDAQALQRTYSIGNGAFMAKFLLVSETRLRVLRYLYWQARKAVRRSAERRWLVWELRGIVGYLVYRLRKRIASG